MKILHILIFFFLLTLSVRYSYSFTISEKKKELEKYYDFLKTVAKDSSDEQIPKLKNYLEQHADFERIYSQLLDQLLHNNEVGAAKKYFQTLSAKTKFRRNSLWMLARILAIQDSADFAFEKFKRALKSGSPTLFFLSDFIDFDHSNKGKFRGHLELEKIALTKAQKRVAQALFHLKNFDYKKITETLTQPPPSHSSKKFALHLLGYSAFKTLNYSLADSCWFEGLALSRADGDLQFEARYLASLSLLKADSGKYKEAHKYIEASLTIARALNDLSRINFAKGHLGTIHLLEGNFDKAYEQYVKAIKGAVPLGAFSIAGQFYNGLAQALIGLEAYDRVLDAFEQSEKYASKANDKSLTFSLWLEKGKFYSRLSLNSQAGIEYHNAYEFAKKYSSQRLDNKALVRIADLLMVEKKYSKARAIYSEALNSSNNARKINKAYWQCMLGETYYFEENFDIAKDEFRKAFEITAHIRRSNYLDRLQTFIQLRIADIEVKVNNFTEASRIYNDDFIKNVTKKNDDLNIDRNYGLGNLYKKKNEFEKAIVFYNHATKLIEQSREELKVEQFRIGRFSQEVEVYNGLIQSYLIKYETNKAKADLEKLYFSLEMSRARTLKDLRFGEKHFNEIVSVQKNGYKKACLALRKIQRQIRNYPNSYDSLEVKYQIARNNVLTKRLQLINENHQTAEKYLSLDETVESLNKTNSGLLFYHISDEISFVLAAGANEVTLVRLKINPTTLGAAIDSLVSPFHNISEESFPGTPFRARIAYRLYKTLVQPVEDKIDLKKQVLIIPDLVLTGLPFEMLLTRAPESSEYLPADTPDYSDHFLLHRFAVVYSPSTWLSNAVKEERPTDGNVLVFANPFTFEAEPSKNNSLLTSRSGWRFDMLLHAEKEAENISKLSDNVKIFKRSEANKVNFFNNVSKYRILHFATHAFVDTIFDAFSGLALAAGQDSTDDGLLMGYEIADLSLNCDLVNLSACETGRGKFVVGEGVLGLPRLFLGAGAKSVLMTHWKVDDKFTSDLMPEFYNNFLNKHLPKAEALRNAKLSMLHKTGSSTKMNYEHPFYWAAFTLYGEQWSEKEKGWKLWIILMLVLISILAGGLSYKRNFYRIRKIKKMPPGVSGTRGQ